MIILFFLSQIIISFFRSLASAKGNMALHGFKGDWTNKHERNLRLIKKTKPQNKSQENNRKKKKDLKEKEEIEKNK